MFEFLILESGLELSWPKQGPITASDPIPTSRSSELNCLMSGVAVAKFSAPRGQTEQKSKNCGCENHANRSR